MRTNIRTIWVGAMVLAMAGMAGAAEPRATEAHFVIDAKTTHPISRFIYGVNRSLEGAYGCCTLTRVGGNRWTAYNWTNNASNAGNDWQFQNDGYLGGGDVAGGALLGAIKDAATHDAGLILTIPMAGYVAADKNGDGDVRKSGANYLDTRFRPMLAAKGAPFTLAPDPKSAKVYADEMANWVKAQCPYAGTDGHKPVFLALDNEPDLWSSTHAEVHPKPATYEEITRKTTEYSRALKAVMPKTLVFGPVNYGWMGFVRLQDAPDAGNRDFQEVYLDEMARAEKAQGKRLLDALDVHWYSEARGGGKRIVKGGNGAEAVAARLQAPRSLWDVSYTEDSWITKDVLRQPIRLLPRLREKIDRHYPGTKLAVTEYNYGGGDHISGAIAEADVLGIFGREGVYAACVWPMAKDESFIAAGLRMYRNFDGHGGSFGDTAVSASTDNPVDTSVYAGTDTTDPKRMVVVAINKTDHAVTARVKLAGAKRYTKGEAFVLAGTSPEPKANGTIAPTETGFDIAMPAYSVTTVRLTTP